MLEGCFPTSHCDVTLVNHHGGLHSSLRVLPGWSGQRLQRGLINHRGRSRQVSWAASSLPSPSSFLAARQEARPALQPWLGALGPCLAWTATVDEAALPRRHSSAAAAPCAQLFTAVLESRLAYNDASRLPVSARPLVAAVASRYTTHPLTDALHEP